MLLTNLCQLFGVDKPSQLKNWGKASQEAAAQAAAATKEGANENGNSHKGNITTYLMHYLSMVY